MSDTFIPDPQPAGTQFIPDAPGASSAQAAGFIPDQPQGRGIWQALKDYPEHFVKGILETPQRAIENSATSLGTGTYDPEPVIAGAMLGGVKLGKTVGGVRAHPIEAAVEAPKPTFIPDEAPSKPVEAPSKPLEAVAKVEDPLAPPEAPKASEPPPAPEPSSTEMNAAQKAARVVKNILSPDTVSPVAEGAAADIRSAGGKAARDTAATQEVFRGLQEKTAKLSDLEKMALNDYIEGRSKGVELADKTLQPVADAVRGAMLERKAKIEKMSSMEKMNFIEDYLAHEYEDPAAAAKFFASPAKEGSGRFTKERTIPTLSDAVAAGLKPKTLDPLQISSRYVANADWFIAANEVIDKGLKDGTLKRFKADEVPPGWKEVNTRRGNQQTIYAPEEYARVYNNFVDKGWNKNPDWAPIWNGLQHTSNAITSLKLGLSGFHAATMAKEAFASGIDRGVAQLFSGQPLKALGSVAVAPGKFIQNAQRGKQFKDVYLKKVEGTPQMREIVDLITEAGGRGQGNKHAADYQYSAMDSYWNAWKRGSGKAEFQAAMGEARQAYGLGSIKVLAKQVGRIMQTVAKPLFEHYIPALKNGAAFDMMSAWLDANPTATRPQQLKAARKVVDEIDNRFGEMIQDNIFWNKTMKQALQTSMLSYSWFLGTARTIGGGTAALARNPARLSMKHPDWKPNANYALALPFVVATANAFYQYLKTGTTPDSVQDLMAPETGGMVKGSGTSKLVKERGQTPGYEKDVFGWLHSSKDEAFNKLSGIIQIPYALARNKDWKDQPIRHSGAPTSEQIAQVLNYVYEQLKPISAAKLKEGQKKGSNITKGEVVLGIKSAPGYLADPKNTAETDKYFSDKAWDERLNWERSHKKNYQGPQ